MLLVALILIVVTACVTIVSTYLLLNAEDYRWFNLLFNFLHFLFFRRWSSFCAGGSVSIYVYLYSIFYYFFKTRFFKTRLINYLIKNNHLLLIFLKDFIFFEFISNMVTKLIFKKLKLGKIK